MIRTCQYCKADIPDFEPYSQAGTCCAKRWWDRQANIDTMVKNIKIRRAFEPEDDNPMDDDDRGDFLYEQMKDRKLGL